MERASVIIWNSGIYFKIEKITFGNQIGAAGREERNPRSELLPKVPLGNRSHHSMWVRLELRLGRGLAGFLTISEPVH